jgi:Xaa-Pro aminopeptidase
MMIIALILAAATQDAKPEFGDAPVYRLTTSKSYPFGERECHNWALPPAEFTKRREDFLKNLQQFGPGTIAIVKSAPVFPRNGDVEHEYRQDSDFYWVTGYPESEAVAIFDPDAQPVEKAAEGFVLSPDASKPRFTLLVLPKDPVRETWTGKRIGPEGAVKNFGADQAATTQSTEKLIKGAIARAKTLVLVNNFDREFTTLVDKTLADLRQQSGEAPRVVDGRKWIHERRLIKTPAEIDAMRRACEVSIEGHLAAMRASRPGMNEGEIEAAAEFAFRALGGPRLGYPSIAGAGNNGCILHYNTNNETLGPNALMLLDAGTEIGNYTADVTRTWPVSGKFTPEQRAIYDIVLRAQNAGIAKCRPGVPVGEVHDAAVAEVTKGLVELGLLQGDPAELIKKNAHRKFFMHGTSHWLGLDVHDSGDYQGKKRALEAGMILTVEPGIYIAMGTPGVDAKWQGIGVRIEDDILVTSGEPENLTGRLPRDPDVLEAIVRNASARSDAPKR